MAKGVDFDEKESRSLERTYQAPEIVRQRQRTLDALALVPGETVMDLGCGPGLLVHDMAERVGPTGRVIGLDTSSAMLRLATARCAELDHVELTEAALQSLPAEDGTLDAITCTQVLLFVPDVPAALSEMRRALKPGGRIAILETDWRGCVLSAADYAMTRRLLDYWDRAVASPNLPSRLGGLIRAAGFLEVTAEAVPILNDDWSEENFSGDFVKGLVKRAKTDGAAPEAEIDAWLDDLHRRGKDGDYFFCINRFLFTARSP